MNSLLKVWKQTVGFCEDKAHIFAVFPKHSRGPQPASPTSSIAIGVIESTRIREGRPQSLAGIIRQFKVFLALDQGESKSNCFQGRRSDRFPTVFDYRLGLPGGHHQELLSICNHFFA